MYEKYFKRLLDLICSVCALIVLSPMFLILIIVGAIMMKGNPFFTQPRPGKNEKIFNLIKFRTMSNAKDKEGNLLPDSQRLNGYGKFLRSTSLDELPELLNIVNGSLSICGPRPFLVRDACFMTPEQRRRHTVAPGLTGLAQANGRNAISWEDKIALDLQYIENITFGGDVKIILQTLGKVFKRADINREGTDSDIDLGDWLLLKNEVTKEEYDMKQAEARELLKQR
jgi:UDP-galactose phosphate transferase